MRKETSDLPRSKAHNLRVGVLPLAALLVGSCVSDSVPAEAAAVKLVPVSSSAIQVDAPRFHRQDGQLHVVGMAALKLPRAQPHPDHHVDVVFIDAGGREIRVDSVGLVTRVLPKIPGRARARGIYSAPIQQLPSGTATIEVRAHDVAHAPP